MIKLGNLVKQFKLCFKMQEFGCINFNTEKMFQVFMNLGIMKKLIGATTTHFRHQIKQPKNPQQITTDIMRNIADSTRANSTPSNRFTVKSTFF